MSHCEAFSFAAFIFFRFLCVKHVKSIFVVRVRIWMPNFSEIFLCFMRIGIMFYACIKRPKIQKFYARIKHINIKHKTKKCLRGTSLRELCIYLCSVFRQDFLPRVIVDTKWIHIIRSMARPRMDNGQTVEYRHHKN